MTSGQRGPLIPWATHVVQWTVQWVAKPQGGANPIKANHSSDCRLKLACMKLESLVTVYQLWHGEYVLGSCTHRPSRHESWEYPKPLPLVRERTKGMTNI